MGQVKLTEHLTRIGSTTYTMEDRDYHSDEESGVAT